MELCKEHTTQKRKLKIHRGETDKHSKGEYTNSLKKTLERRKKGEAVSLGGNRADANMWMMLQDSQRFSTEKTK